MGIIRPVAAPAAEAVVVFGGTVVTAVVMELGLWPVEVEDGVLLAAALVGAAAAAEVVEDGMDRL